MTETLGLLINDVARTFRREFDARARRIGVTRAQWHVLAVLARNEGCNQGALAEIMEVEPITIARMIDRLEDAGLVERRRDPNDRRAWRIHLTNAVQPLLAQLRVIGEGLSQDALAGFSAEQQTSLHMMLTQLRANLSNEEMKEAANG